MSQEPLLSISDASHILGVSEAALRQWTDEGKLKAFITPGGHRRYSRADLKKFMSPNQKQAGIKDLAIGLEDTVELHRQISRNFNNAIWYNNLTPQSRMRLAELSRQIFNAIIKYVTEPAKRDDALKLAQDTGRGFGETLARLGLPLTDSVEAFVLHREPIMNTAILLVKKRQTSSSRIIEAIPLAARVTDDALVCLVAAHQKCWNESNNGSKEGIPA
ncbi:MAG: helix-turn-helix domain-containing protein [Chloroflexi bacterium]|nr:helix-turn-helix domain-containing protein [Chloroflexota bacterium]